MAYRVESSDTETLTVTATTIAVNHGAHLSGDLILDTVWNQTSAASTISLGSDAGTLSAGADTFTYTGSHYFDDGIQVQFTGTLGSLTAGTHYFVRDLNTGAKTFKLALTSGGAAIDITGSPGSATCFRMTGGASANNNCVGWNIEPDQALSTNLRGVVIWKIATSSSTPIPTFTTAASGGLHAFSQVIRDIPASNPIDGTKRTNYTAVTSAASSALTTSTDDCLIIYVTGTATGSNLRIKTTEATTINTSIANGNDQYQLIAYRQMNAAGAVPSVTTYFQASSNAQTWTIAIKNKTNGTLQSWADSGLNEVAWYGTHGSPLGTITWQSLENFSLATAGAFVVGVQYSIVSAGTTDFTLIGSANNTVGTIFTATGAGTGTGTASRTVNGLILGTTGATTSNNSDGNNWGGNTSFTTSENFASPSTKWVGSTHTLSFPDLTGKIFSIEWLCSNSNSGAQWGNDGHLIGFADGNGNYVTYQVFPKFGWIGSKQYRISIELGVATAYASSGSINWAAVTRIGFFMHRSSGQTGATSEVVKNAVLFSDAVITGGGSSSPATFYDAHKALTSSGIILISTLQGGTSQIASSTGVQIGNGTLKTYFDSSAQALAFPPAYNAISQKDWRVSADKLTLGVYAKSTDTINIAAGAAVSNQEENLTINASSDTGATYSVAGQSFVNWKPTWKTGVPCSGATFKLCNTVAFKGASPTGISVSKTTSTNAAVSWDTTGATLTNSTITVADTAITTDYHIELGTSVTEITLTDVTFSGAAGTNKVHVLKTSATVAAGAFVTGKSYEIKTVGTTDFTTIGASANTIGVRFTATGAGSGSGDAYAAVKITTSGTTTLTEGQCTSAGAVVWVAAPIVTQGLAFTGLVAGSQVKVFASGTTTELFTTSSSGTSETFSQTRVTDITVDYTIMKAGYIPIRVVGISLSTAVLSTPISQVVDRAYAASSGLTFTTNATANTSTKIFSINAATTVQNWYSFMIESWIAQSSLKNTAFPLSVNGPNSITLGLDWEWRGWASSQTQGNGIANTSLALLSRDGMRYVNTAGTQNAIWAAILSSGVPAGKTVHYQQTDGGTTVAAANTGNIDQLIQVYGTASYGNFDYRNWLVLKVQADGYDQAEFDAVTAYGNMEDQEYVVSLTPTSTGLATGSPTVNGSPAISSGTYVVGGKTFSLKIVDGVGENTGTILERWLRYNYSLGGTFQGKDGFCWHDLIRTNGTKFKTVNGVVYGTATTKGVIVYKNDGTTLHPDFNLFTADDGTTYTPPTTATITISGATTGSRVQLYDTTHSAELYNGTPTFPFTYSETYASDKAIRLRVSYCAAATANQFLEANIGSITSTALDLSYLVAPVVDAVYVANAINGSTVTGITITPSPGRVAINLSGGGTISNASIYAYQCYWLFGATGISDEAAFISAPDAANYLYTNFKWKNTSGTTLTITDGFPRDSSTGLSSTLIDTTGYNICVAVEHAIQVAVGAAATIAIVQSGMDANGYTQGRAPYIDKIPNIANGVNALQ